MGYPITKIDEIAFNMSEALLQFTEAGSIPSGVIVMWSGAANTIPGGWAICDSANGTPDLRNRFIVGAGSTYAVGATGGEASHKLTVAELPSHTHTFSGNAHSHSASPSGMTASESGAHKHTGSVSAISLPIGAGIAEGSYYKKNSYNQSFTTSESGAHTHTITGSVSVGSTTATGTNASVGSGVAHNNLPPYYALCFIMKL